MKLYQPFSVFMFLHLFVNQVKAQETILTGKLPANFISQEWAHQWLKISDEYVVDAAISDSLRKSNLKDLSIEVFLGTWCEDSEKLVPQFIQLNKRMLIPVIFMGVDKDKNCPLQDCSVWNIQYVPTFAIKRKDVEIGRIVEHVSKNIETDLLHIIGK